MSIPSLVSIAPVHSAVKEYTFSGLFCTSSLSCEGVYLLWSPLHQVYPLLSPLHQFTQLWRCILSSLQCTSSLSCEGVSLWSLLHQFTQLWIQVCFLLFSFGPFHSINCEGVSSLASIVLVHSAVNTSMPSVVLFWREPVWPRGKQRDLSSNPLRLSFLFKSCGLWTLSCDFVPHS